MDPRHFDALTRRLWIAGSRRGLLAALGLSFLSRLPGSLRPPTVTAGCATFDHSCQSNASCCQGLGLRCRDGRCRCQQGWKHCTGGPGCKNVNNDPGHCGKCDKKCPTAKPCCIKGKCREKCGDTCCADCFVELFINGVPDLDDPKCCKANGGTICEHRKPGQADDRCCYPNEVCVKGTCCCDDCLGSVKCGGNCCAIAACCNGKCCKQGEVCATKHEDDPKESCVPANRTCDGDGECFPGETCHGGKCCSGNRMCVGGTGAKFCCKAGEYCELPGTFSANCCPVNTICKSTYRGHRVRR
jgi:hypothetical protein